MASGVTLVDPATTYVEADVEVGQDTVIHPAVTLEGRTTIGVGCEIRSGCRLTNATLGDGVTLLDYTLVTEASVDAGAHRRAVRPTSPRCAGSARRRTSATSSR